MSFRRSRLTASEVKKVRRKHQTRRHRLRQRQPQLEGLERRELLAVGPQLLGISADGGQPLSENQVLNIAPRTLTFNFEDTLPINPATLGGIRMTRSVNDVFGDADDRAVPPGSIGIGDGPNVVVARFDEPLPDDRYRIDILGSGSGPLTNTAGEPFNEGADVAVHFQLELGAQITAVTPQPVARNLTTGELSQAANQILVHFNDDPLNATTAARTTFYQLVNEDDGSLLLPEEVQYSASSRRAVLTFADDLPGGNFRLDIGRSSEANDTLVDAINVGTLDVQYGATESLGDTSAGDNDVDLFRFHVLEAGTVTATVSPAASLNAVVRLFGADGLQLSGVNGGAAGVVETLVFLAPAAGTYYLGVSSQGNTVYDPINGSGAAGGTGSGSYTLGLAFDQPLDVSDDDNSTFESATQLGVLGDAGREFGADIEARAITVALPGGLDEPGHRDVPPESHINSGNPFPSGPLTVAFYNFEDIYGTDPQGNILVNAITENQKQRAREVFEIFTDAIGVQFVESESLGLTVVTGDPRAVDPTVSTGPGGVAGISEGTLTGRVVMDAAENWGDSEYGGEWFETAMHEIGHSLGLGHTYDLPALTVLGDSNSVAAGRFPDPGEAIFPGNNDLVHLERLHPPRSNDLDLYRFEVIETGTLTVETVAERLQPSASLLDSKLLLYQDGATRPTVIASNDDYFGRDSYLELELAPGVYYLGVASTGLEDIDPVIPESGFGGTSDGPYRLEIDFQAAAASQITDRTGTQLDGDSDGDPGGTFTFWFQSGRTIFVDRANDAIAGPEGDGSLADPFDTISSALQLAADRVNIPEAGGVRFEDGQTFILSDGVRPPVTFEFDSGLGTAAGNVPVPFSASDTAVIIAGALATAINGTANLDVSAAVSGSQVQLSGADRIDLAGTPPLLSVPNIVRVVGNGGLDNDLTTPGDNLPYLVGLDAFDAPLRDGKDLLIPQGATLMVDAGALFKLQGANVTVGSSAQGVSRSQSALQVLGAPGNPVYFRHFGDDSFGGDSDGPSQGVEAGGWGGLVFRADSDLESEGIFLNWVNHADLSHGGGKVFVDGEEVSFTPIHLVSSRPTISHNVISNSADAAISAGPLSFDDSLGRIGPDIHNNQIEDNSINGLFVRIATEIGQPLDRFRGNARWDDTDIVHVLTENLQIASNPGGPILDEDTGDFVARPAGRLRVDSGVIVKLEGARIEAELGAQLIAEGTRERPVIFTSQKDDSFGGSGASDTSGDGNATPPLPGQWGGLLFNANSRGSLDNVLITYAGGRTPIEGGFASFDAVEIHQADVRLTRSTLRNNTAVADTSDRNGRGSNERATIFVRGAQPIIVGNTLRNNTGDVVNVDPSSLSFDLRVDPGRSTGRAERFTQFDNNRGPLVRLNRMTNNGINGMVVRGGTLTTESVWDDTDIAHVVEQEIIVSNHHTFSGLQLRSNQSGSLVIKLDGPTAGFTATGTPLDIEDRIGGSLYVLGTASNPVIFTSIEDDSITAGLDPQGRPLGDTNNNGTSVGLAQDWRSIRLDRYSNDRNVQFINESESVAVGQQDRNATPATAQVLGTLAPNSRSGDDNQTLGFKVRGFISLDSPADVDVYSFRGTTGAEVWIDIDRTHSSLDSMVELVDATGRVLARATDNGNLSGLAQTMIKDAWLGGDFYTVNPRDAAMRVILPGAPGATNNYFVRVRSEPAAGDLENVRGGLTRGEYELQIRLQQVDEQPGSTVRYANIHFATNGIEVLGLPSHSPLTGDSFETGPITDLGNLLVSDRGTLTVGGQLDSPTNVDLYRFSVDYDLIQAIGGFNGTFPTIFDIDYADGLSRPDTTVAVFDESGTVLLVSRDSNIQDDQPGAGRGADLADLSRGSFGRLDAFIGSVQLPAGAATAGNTRTYFVAVMSNAQLPTALNGTFDQAGNSLVRLEPVSSWQRIAEDHLGFEGYTSGNTALGQTSPVLPTTQLFDITTVQGLEANVVPLTLEDMVLYVAQPTRLFTVNPFNGLQTSNIGALSQGAMLQGQSVQDIAMRSDGNLWAIENLPLMTGTAGTLSMVDPATGVQGNRMNDAIPDFQAGPPPMGLDSDISDAFAWRRAGFDLTMNMVEYDLYYSVRDPMTGESVLYRADPDNGSAAEVDMEPWGPQGQIPGVGITTGLAFAVDDEPRLGEQLYGVSDRGLFYRILRQTGVPFHPVTGAPFQGLAVPGLEIGEGFEGLASGPQLLQGGAFANLLFALTDRGRILALDTNGVPQPVFEGGATSITTGLAGATGLAFSPLDFNLWHPTLVRRGDAGHGINPTFDQSRPDPSSLERTINGRMSNEGEGGASFYFGFEPWEEFPNINDVYFTYGQNAQYGATLNAHRDLSTNTLIGGNNYNLPGGAQGKLLTNSFSLADYVAADKPTLYFNYFLETEGVNDLLRMVDSARVYITPDDGDTWSLLATNNSVLSVGGRMAELPEFISATASVSSHPQQRVQELFDNTGAWRQARVDLSEFAGVGDLKVRFDFATAGSFNQGLNGDEFGAYFETERNLNNDFEGFFVDDIMIGITERGEMVTNPPSGLGTTFQVPQNPDPAGASEILVGDYQLEIRRGTETASLIDSRVGDIVITQLLDTNDRLIAEESRLGDRNLPREQGHIQIELNRIENVSGVGIVFDAGARGTTVNRPSPGSVRNLPTLNNPRLVPAATIENNLIVNAAGGGIRFSGDLNSGNVAVAAVPFGRILNNTIFEGAVGIEVSENASPTILNNIIANTNTAISIDSSSASTVVGANLYSANANDGALGANSIVLSENDPLFIDPERGNFYLAPGSKAIDSSMNSLVDRPSIVAVRSPLQIPPSPIVVPDRDFFGQLRIDDPSQEPPPGLGSNIFKDRGAIERADFVGPTAELISPLDQGAEDLDSSATVVRVNDVLLTEILIRVTDAGLGVDFDSLDSNKVGLELDGQVLVAGEDFQFNLDRTNSTVRLTDFPNNGRFREVYEVTLDNSGATGIRDLADTVLRSNRAGGTTAFTIITAGLNQPPVAMDDTATTVERVPITIDVLANDLSPDSPILTETLSIVAEPANGATLVNSDGSITYVSVAGFTGVDTFSYTIADRDGDTSNEGLVTVTVMTDVNDAPVLDNSVAMRLSDINEDDTDSPGDTVAAIIGSAPGDAITDADIGAVEGLAVIGVDDTNGQWQYDAGSGWTAFGAVSPASATLLNPVARIRFVPNPDYNGLSGNLTLRAWDQTSGTNGEQGVDTTTNGGESAYSTATNTAMLAILPVNDAPRPGDDDDTNPGGLNTTEDQAFTIAGSLLLSNDRDDQPGPLRIVSVDRSATQGLVQLRGVSSGSVTITYDPNGRFNFLKPGETATDSYRYTVQESSGLQGTGTVTVTIHGVNDAPVADDDSYSTDEDTILTVPVPGVLSNDVDPENDTLTVVDAPTGSSQGATVSVNADGSFSYDPSASVLLQSLRPGQSRLDTFTYRVSDGAAESTATATITVDGRNDAPTAVDDSYTMIEDRVLVVSAANGVLANDSDLDGDSFTAALETPPSNGSVTLNSDGSFRYQPSTNFSGSDTFAYRASDAGSSAVATVTIVVSNVNDAPIAVDDQYEVDQDMTLVVSAANGVLSNDSDPDGETLSAERITDPQSGTVSMNSDGSFTYTPAGGFFGETTFVYRAFDAAGASATATVKIGVVNTRPWRNPSNPLDANGDRSVSPADVLVIINYLNEGRGGPVPVPTPMGPPFRDVNGDNEVSSADALQVINFINQQLVSAEGEVSFSGDGRQDVLAAERRVGPTVLPVSELEQGTGSTPREADAELIDTLFRDGNVDRLVPRPAQSVAPAGGDGPLPSELDELLEAIAHNLSGDELDALFGRLST